MRCEKVKVSNPSAFQLIQEMGTKAHIKAVVGIKAHIKAVTGIKAHIKAVVGIKAHIKAVVGIKAHIKAETGMKAHIKPEIGIKAQSSKECCDVVAEPGRPHPQQGRAAGGYHCLASVCTVW